jgi:hypothetical protein
MYELIGSRFIQKCRSWWDTKYYSNC